MNKYKFIINVLLLSFIFTTEIEISINSIVKVSDSQQIKDVDAYGQTPSYYEIEFYVLNTDEDIAGFQFTLHPEGIFNISKEDIYGGASSDAGFITYTGKGTILGFSMTGNVIPASLVAKQLFTIRADIKNLSQFRDSNITLENLVVASKKGETLPSYFEPYQLSKIK